MKISILTPTYNRENTLKKLYNSLIKNKSTNAEIEWLIMDDGSTDNTKQLVNNFIKENIIEIKYFYQENSGKMAALNELVEKASGDLILECDSDDYLTDGAISIIEDSYYKCNSNQNLYAMCFLKYDNNNCNMGNLFKNEYTTMFDLYFKEGEDGEKALVYFSKIRKQYKYKFENNEKFSTEARLHHELDEKYQIFCVNIPIMICEYRKDGYTENIKKIFKENPFGYYKYFEEILKKDFKGVKFKKRLYVIKHVILFSCLTGKRDIFKVAKGLNKFLLYILYLPGKVKSKGY